MVECIRCSTLMGAGTDSATAMLAASPEFNDSDNSHLDLMVRAEDGTQVTTITCHKSTSISFPLTTRAHTGAHKFLLSADVHESFEKSSVGVRGTSYIRVTEVSKQLMRCMSHCMWVLQVIISCQFCVKNYTNVPLYISCPGVNATLPGREETEEHSSHNNSKESVAKWYQNAPGLCGFSSPILEPELEIAIWDEKNVDDREHADQQKIKLAVTSKSHALALITRDAHKLHFNCHVSRTKQRWSKWCVVLVICPCATVRASAVNPLLAAQMRAQCCWVLLGAAGCCCAVGCWVLLGTDECYWVLLGTVFASYWVPLCAGCSCVMRAISG